MVRYESRALHVRHLRGHGPPHTLGRDLGDGSLEQGRAVERGPIDIFCLCEVPVLTQQPTATSVRGRPRVVATRHTATVLASGR